MNDAARLLPAAVLAASVCAAGPAHAERIDCPAGIVYGFAFSDGRAGPGADEGWSVSLHRVEGERSAALPKVSLRRGAMVCEYALPNGAFALARMPIPEGAGCAVEQDDIFTLPYFVCE